MKCIRSYGSLFFIAVIIAGCASSGAPLESTLHTENMHRLWQVTTAMPGSGKTPPLLLDLRDVYHSRLVAGCDTITLTPHYGHHQRLQLHDIRHTYTSCSEAAYSHSLAERLRDVASFSVNEKQLRLMERTGRVLLEAVPAAQDAPRDIYREWSVVSLIHINDTAFAGKKAFIRFDHKQSAASMGCNRFSFAATVSGAHTVSLTPPAGTRMFCKETAIVEDVFLKTIPLVHLYQIVGNRLKLLDKDNVLLLEAVTDL